MRKFIAMLRNDLKHVPCIAPLAVLQQRQG